MLHREVSAPIWSYGSLSTTNQCQKFESAVNGFTENRTGDISYIVDVQGVHGYRWSWTFIFQEQNMGSSNTSKQISVMIILHTCNDFWQALVPARPLRVALESRVSLIILYQTKLIYSLTKMHPAVICSSQDVTCPTDTCPCRYLFMKLMLETKLFSGDQNNINIFCYGKKR